MAESERAFEVEGLKFQIPPGGVDALLRGEGVDLRLSMLSVRLTEAALNAMLARFAPQVRARLSAGGMAIDREGARKLHLDVAANRFRLSFADGELRVESEQP
jgi:hypothetical protein